MKRLLLVVFVALFMQATFAQELGVRFGSVGGNNVAIDGVFELDNTRLHADLTFASGIGLEAVYEFVFNPLGDVDNLYYYGGLGANLWLGDPFTLGVLAEIGLEYRFVDVPIALGLDYRPTLNIISTTDFRFDRFGFNARWIF